MSLESRNYVASPADIESITRDVLHAQSTGSVGRASYLRALIATTQAELGATPRQRHSTPGKLPHDEIGRQISALEAVHDRFYVIVLKTIGKCSAIELNRRSNFARSAKSTARSWIKVGNDITSLVAAKTTKASLAVDTRQKRATSAHILAKQMKRNADRFETSASKLAGTDKSAAAEAVGAMIEKLQGVLSKLGVRRSARRSGAQDGHHTSV